MHHHLVALTTIVFKDNFLFHLRHVNGHGYLSVIPVVDKALF